ncbi:DUF6166 domain-containing protein [Roseomonas sp. GCM10028921]
MASPQRGADMDAEKFPRTDAEPSSGKPGAKAYIGFVDGSGSWSVHVLERTEEDEAVQRPLPLYLEVASHSATGFGWGYSGAGPAQLALALLCDLAGSERALRYYQDFNLEVTALLPRSSGWILEEEDLRAWLEGKEKPDTHEVVLIPPPFME